MAGLYLLNAVGTAPISPGNAIDARALHGEVVSPGSGDYAGQVLREWGGRTTSLAVGLRRGC